MKIKIAKVTSYVADDGTEFDSMTAMMDHQFREFLEGMVADEVQNLSDAVDFIARNWMIINTARTNMWNVALSQEKKAIKEFLRNQDAL